MNGCRCNVAPDLIGTGSGMQSHELSMFQTLLTHKPWRQSISHGAGKTAILATPPNRPRRMTIQTRANIEPKTEPDGQGPLANVQLSEDSSEEYKNEGDVDESRADTEITVDPSYNWRGNNIRMAIGRRRFTERETVSEQRGNLNHLWMTGGTTC